MGTIIILHSISTDFNHSAFISYYRKFCSWSIHEDDMVDAEDETEQENKLQENDSDISSDDEVNHTQQY